MQIKFKISCLACHCCFELDSEKFKDRENLACPNCGQPFPDREFLHMQNTMSELRSISELCASSSMNEGFRVSITSAENADCGIPF